MVALLDFFKGIANALVSIIDFVISLFEDLIYMIKLLGKVIGNIPSYFSWLPGELLAILVVLIGIVVVYKILGREG